MRFNSFLEILEFYAKDRGDSPALRCDRCGAIEAVSSSELLGEVRARSEELRQGAMGFGHESRLEAILADGSYGCVVEIFAAAAAGIPIALLDADAPVEVLKEQLAACDAGFLWGDEDTLEELQGCAGRSAAAKSGDILFFTSGTTQRSKPVVLTEQSLCASAYNGGALLPLSASDTLLCMLPLSHVFGFVCGLLWGLSCGACVALGRGPRHYMDDTKVFAPTALSAVPLLLNFLVQRDLLNPELKLVLVGAGDCPPLLLAAAAMKGIRVSFGYGLTETSSGLALSLGDDPFAMTVCPDDRIQTAEDGEILVSAPSCIMKGYYRNEAATKEAFTADGMLKTGDLGYLDGEGLLHITGRKKDVLVFADGTKLFLPEAESELAKLLPGCELALAQKRSRTVLAVYGEGLTEETVWQAIKPWQKAKPRAQQIAQIMLRSEKLPRTATGKVKRWEL